MNITHTKELCNVTVTIEYRCPAVTSVQTCFLWADMLVLCLTYS